MSVVLADRAQSAQTTDSRNGAGKTTLVQIIDFCLGARGRGETLEKLEGKGWDFTLAFDVMSHELSVTRDVDDPSSVKVEGPLREVGLLESDDDRRALTTTISSLTDWLGAVAYQLPARVMREQNAPTFRRLLGHQMRYRADAFNSPFESFAREPSVATQVDNAFLLGLDWGLATEWQRLKDRAKTLDALGRQGVEEATQELGELEARRARLDSRVRKLRQQVSEFRVLPEYRDIELRANERTQLMQNLANDRTANRRLLSMYETQLGEASQSADATDIETIFSEASVLFGDDVKRSLQQVAAFHEQVARNRRDYLESEVRRLLEEDARLTERLTSVEEERRHDLQLLSTSGAIDDFGALQQRLGQASAELEATDAEILRLRALRNGKAALRLETLELQERVSRDLDERRESYSDVVADFADIFERLYGEPADLVVDVGAAGYQFRTVLPKSGSHGVGKISIFAYDLAIATAWARRGHGLGFVIHDSVLFDGVDERQKAAALALAGERGRELGFQYIVTLNSDDVPFAELEHLNMKMNDYVVSRLTDQSEDGGILGMRV